MEQDRFDFLPLRVIRIGPSGRRVYDPEGKRKLIAACRQSGVSVSQLARSPHVKAKLLHNWLAQDNKQFLRVASDSAFVPVLEIESSKPRNQSAMAENRSDTLVSQVSPTPLRLTAHLRNGVDIELHCTTVDTALVVAAIHSLGTC